MHPRPRRLAVVASALLTAAVVATLGTTTAAADTGTAALADVACDDLLVVHRPDGTSGDGAAVAVTAQAFERGVPGWSSVGWSAAEGTVIREVLVVGTDGVTVVTGSPTGAAGQAAELRFCGTTGTTGADAADDADDVTDVAAVAAGAPTSVDGGGGDAATAGLGVLGASIGTALGLVVLLLSWGSRNVREVRR